MIGLQCGEGHRLAGSNYVASSLGNKIKEKKRVAWIETNQSFEKKKKKKSTVWTKSQIQRTTNNPLQYEKNQKRKMTGY